MPYTTADGRRQLLQDLASAAGQLADALASLTEAYERMDEDSADRLEAELFRPVQAALGSARRTYSEFAGRYDLARHDFATSGPGLPQDATASVEQAIDALEEADESLAELQDSMLPVEVGDQEVRAGLSHIRELIAPLPARARDLLRTLGR